MVITCMWIIKKNKIKVKPTEIAEEWAGGGENRRSW